MELAVMDRMNAAEIRHGDEVTAVSLWEPSATLIALGLKTIETRSWMTNYRGPLLICAAKRTPRLNLIELEFFMGSLSLEIAARVAAALGVDVHRKPVPTLGDLLDCLSPGHAVALVDLYDCICADSFEAKAEVDHTKEGAFGDFSPGRWAWLTRSLRRLKPFPVTGRKRLFHAVMAGPPAESP